MNMKKLFYVLTLLVMVSISSTCLAVSSRDVNSVGFDSLSETDKLEIMQSIAKKKANLGAEYIPQLPGGDVASTSPEVVSKWVQIGSDIGKGLAGAAKELGIAANEFANTPVGKVTVALIIWHFMGGTLLHIFGGLLVAISGIAFVVFYARSCKNVEETYDGTTWWGGKKLQTRKKTALGDGDLGSLAFISFVVLVAWAITTFS